MKQRIFILGASGNVGRELVSQIIKNDSKKNHVNPSIIIGVANSKNYIFNSKGIAEKYLKQIISGREMAKKVFDSNGKKIGNILSLLDLVKKEGMEGEVIFADVTAGTKELLYFHKALVSDTQNFLVTANKNPISLYSAEAFKYLTSYKGRYNTNTTVMGGAGVLGFVDERADKIGDKILKIQGMFSGTLGYILSKLELGKQSFSEIVKETKEKGYTEPNPWDDLNGLDVARKLIILARYAGYDVNMKDVKINPLINNKYANYEGERFLDAIKAEDKDFAEKVFRAKERGEVLRYIGEMTQKKGKVRLKVGLKSVSKNSDLGTLNGTSNLAIVETEILKDPLPHIIKSRGAGLAVTAGAVRVGIANMLPNYLKTR